MPAPKAVLLDVGGIFHLPNHDRIHAAFARAEFAVETAVLDRAHYAGAAQFTVHTEGELDWAGRWKAYLDAYITTSGVDEDDAALREDVHRHLDSEFSVGDLWSRIIP